MKRKGLWGAVGLLILAGMIGCMCVGILQTQKEEKAEGYLVFNYDEVGPYGSLYYMTFAGEKTLITSRILDEDSDYFGLDEDRNLVFYRDESGALYMMKIGEKPEKIVDAIDGLYRGIEKEISPRYLIGVDHDDGGEISYILIDKDKRVVHRVRTGFKKSINESKETNPLSLIHFDEEKLALYYRDDQHNMYCSTNYEAPKQIEQGAYISDEKNTLLYKKEQQGTEREETEAEETGYIFLNGVVEGETLKASEVGRFQVEEVNGTPTVFFDGRRKADNGLYMQRKGEEAILLAMGNVWDWYYIPQQTQLYYEDEDGSLMSLDISKVDTIGRGKEKKLAADIRSFDISSDGELVTWEIGGYEEKKSLYVMTKEGPTLLASDIEYSEVRDKQLTYYETKNGYTSLKCYTQEHGIQTLIEHAEDYSMIKIRNQLYKSKTMYSQVVGYYYNEAFDTFIEMTRNQEMIIYNEGKEKARAFLRVEEDIDKEDINKEKLTREELMLSPSNGINVTADVFKTIFWNDEIFLTKKAVFTKPEYSEKIELRISDKTLYLDKLDEVAFRNQLGEQAKLSRSTEKALLTRNEAVLFTKWYISYLGQEMPKHIEVDHETKSHYIVYTYDLVVTQTQEKPKAPNHQYLVDKESGEIVALGEKNPSKGMVPEDKMTYEIAVETLWMVDEQGSRGRLVNLEGLYSEQRPNKEQSGEYLWQYGNNVYFVISEYDTQDDYYQDTLWRYDLVKRKASRLTGVCSAFGSKAEYTLEAEREAIKIEYYASLHELARQRIDLVTGETQVCIAQYPYRDYDECTIATEGDFIYEIISLPREWDYFISEYNKKTKHYRQLCKVDICDFYSGHDPEQAIKVGDEIYFMDYTHYLTSEEIATKGEWEIITTYCKVNVKTGKVSRVNEQTYQTLLRSKS